MDFSKSKVLTFEQGCQYLGYAKSYVYKLTSAGILPFSKPNGKTIFFEREKLEDWMLSNSSTTKEEKQIIASTYINTKRELNPLPQLSSKTIAKEETSIN